MPSIYMSYPFTGAIFTQGQEVRIAADIDQSGLTSAYSAYGIKFYIDDVGMDIVPVASDWTAETSFTFRYAGTYEIYGQLVNKSTGVYLGYQTGTVVITVASTRPSNWSWTSTVSQGATIPNWTNASGKRFCKPLTATEWNGFIDRIAQFMSYKGYSFSGGSSSSDLYVVSNTEMDPDIVDVAGQLIDMLGPTVAVPDAPDSGSRIRASYFNGLKNALNSIQ